MLTDATDDYVEMLPSSAPAEPYEDISLMGLTDRGFVDWLRNLVK